MSDYEYYTDNFVYKTSESMEEIKRIAELIKKSSTDKHKKRMP